MRLCAKKKKRIKRGRGRFRGINQETHAHSHMGTKTHSCSKGCREIQGTRESEAEGLRGEVTLILDRKGRGNL